MLRKLLIFLRCRKGAHDMKCVHHQYPNVEYMQCSRCGYWTMRRV